MRWTVGVLVAVVHTACTPETNLRGEQQNEVQPRAEMRVSPLTLAFGSLPLGETATHTFSIENPGDGPLTVESLTIDGDRSFVIADLAVPPFVVAPGATHVVDVVYVADDVEETADILVLSDAPDEPEATVSLSGSWG